nr:DUF1501 domain-containing protein [Streptomyces sp. SID4926]
MAGTKTAGAAVRLGGKPLPDAWQRACEELSHQDEDAHPLLRRAATSLGDLRQVSRSFDAKSDSTSGGKDEEDEDGATEGNEGGSAGAESALGAQLDVVARAIEAGVSTRAYSVSLGGFDTHANEKGTQSRLLAGLDRDLGGFLTRVRRTAAGRKVVVAVYSEFGRRPKDNANQGTDHGTAGPLFVLGEPVRGGFHGEQPALDDLTDDDLRTTTDFRAVYATLLREVLGTDPGAVLDGYDKTLAFL